MKARRAAGPRPTVATEAVSVELPWLGGTMIALAIFLFVVLLWRGGLLQVAEFYVYDRFIQWRASPDNGVSRVVVVGITEADIQRVDPYPLSDGKLAELLRQIVAAQPAAVAVDLFRPKSVTGPEPDGPGQLRALFTDHPNVIGIKRVGIGNRPSVPPSPALQGLPDQVGCADYAVDERVDSAARRGLLMIDDGGSIDYSIALLTTLLYLQMHDIAMEQNPQRPEELTLGQAHLRPMQPNDGAYVGADTRGYQLLLDFRKHRGSEDRGDSSELVFPCFSLHDILEGRVAPEQLAGKVVLIGTSATSMKDYMKAPLGERYSGVMMHAQLVDQLLRSALDGDRTTRSWPEPAKAVWILAWTVAGLTLGLRVRAPITLAIGSAAALAALGATTWLAFRAGYWLLTIAPASGFTLAAALAVAFVSQREWNQRMLLMQLFGRHVAPEIAEAVWENRAAFYAGAGLRPQKLTATVLFTDLRGFSTTSEAMAAEELMAWLNQYMNAMSELVAEHGGVLNKFLGDGLMAVFGAPLSRTTREEIQQDAANAVRCAQAMGRRLERLNREWVEAGQPSSALRVGIHTGPLVAGSLGGAARLEYTVIGDTVNIASRLESTLDEALDLQRTLCRILASENTHELLDGQFETRQVGSVALRGKTAKVTVYLVAESPSEKPEHTL